MKGVSIMSLGEAARAIGVSAESLRRWTKEGKIPSLRSPGGWRYFLREDIEKWIQERIAREEKKDR